MYAAQYAGFVLQGQALFCQQQSQSSDMLGHWDGQVRMARNAAKIANCMARWRPRRFKYTQPEQTGGLSMAYDRLGYNREVKNWAGIRSMNLTRPNRALILRRPQSLVPRKAVPRAIGKIRAQSCMGHNDE